MPELPDVAVFEQYIHSTSLQQKITDVDVLDADVLKNVSKRRLTSVVKGARFKSTRRHGKHLFIELSGDRGWLEMHFGMTGEPKYYKDSDEQPNHARVVFRFAKGYRLAFDCQRKLGHISLIDDPESFTSKAKLGPDALDEASDWKPFREAIGGKRGTIKSALMSQKNLAGIGNVYSDEILFQAHVHPQTQVSALDEKRLKGVHRATRKVLKTAIDRKVDVEKMPRTWLTPHRDNGSCPRCGSELKTAKVGGRTSRFCTSCQPKNSG